MANEEAFGSATLRRIEGLTILLGMLGTAWAGWRWGWRGGLAMALGAGLSWLNFRWLKTGVQAFGKAAAAQAGMERVKIPLGAYLKFFGRFALLLLSIYVILTDTSLPAVPFLAGLFAAAAGVVVGLVFELVSSGVRQSANGNS